MKFVIAPDKFKGSLTGFEFCDAVEEGLSMVFPDAEILKMPLADGGDGTIEVVKHYLKGEKIMITANDPLFRPIKASYLYSAESNVAYVEMAEASGLNLLNKQERNCLYTSTFGTGELILDALKKGAKEIIVGVGGSATNDGGMGMASALGYQFLDKNGRELKPIGKNLVEVAKIDTSNVPRKLQEAKIKVACDVSNPFHGMKGAAKVYAAQKGASLEEIESLDKGLRNFSKIIMEKYAIELQKIKGSGAAGGIGGGAIVFLNGKLNSGIEMIKELANFDIAIKNTDWIITGEGKLDEQTLSGKTINGVVKSAKLNNTPVAAFCGSIDLSIEHQQKLGVIYATSIVQGVSNLDQAMKFSFPNLVYTTYNFANFLKFTYKGNYIR
ncbi:glycerate kinase [Gramella sp. AN32]|uniref:Glycerate kinase n=1 Tax=Christiangramia antarctica TaxID=2058158 RepID=A0ABW5X1T9_9FLAO|nr:glycerate kinase [Gramella sp. AN32]MCM4156731.1 glycerate kinase [Gramella sp. AN32]